MLTVNACAVSSHVSVFAGDFFVHLWYVCVVCVCIQCVCVCVRAEVAEVYHTMSCLPIVSDRAATEGSKYFELGQQSF